MADNTFNNIIGLPTEVLTLIGQNLTTSELAQFKKTCRLFNTLGSDSNFLKPLYHRLYKLDKMLPISLAPEKAPEQFKKAFEEIRDRQKQEINFLNHYHPQAYRIEINALLTNAGNTIEKLEERNALLNSINSSIIDAAIAEQPRIFLKLNNKGLTRFIITKDKVNYFKKLINLTCSGNPLTTLNLEGLTALKTLLCSNNRLTHLNLVGCPALETVICGKNQLTTLNLEGFSRLQGLSCPYNQIKTLNLKNCSKLVWLKFDWNNITTLNLTGCIMLGWAEGFNSNPLATLNLQSASQYIQATYSHLEEKLLFRKLSYATAPSERVEIIKILGRRYTLSNCLKHGCVYEAGLISYQGATASVYIGFCSVVNRMPRFLPSFSSRRAPNEAPLNETIEQKRKRENNNNNEGTEHKKPRPDGA